jgi:hypothetical protein
VPRAAILKVIVVSKYHPVQTTCVVQKDERPNAETPSPVQTSRASSATRAYMDGLWEQHMPDETDNELARRIDLLWSQRAIERMIYAVGYAIEDGDFQKVGDIMGDATMGADLIGRKAFKGSDEIRDQYSRTNIVYPGRGRASKEIYHNILVEIDLDNQTATSVTSYTVPHQPPDAVFELIVAGRYEDEWERRDGVWRWIDRYIVVQFKNDLNKHMHSGTQPYN